MDILSHILWTYLPFKKKEWCSKAIVFAVLPDAGYLLIMLYGFLGAPSIKNAILPAPLMISYHLLHSFITLGLVAIVIWKLRPDLLYAMSGWVLHILIDIPSHQGDFSTRFLYPVFPNAHIEGISWSNFEVLALSYSLFILLYFFSIWRGRRKNRMGDEWKTDWIDRINIFAGVLINNHIIPMSDAASGHIQRTFNQISGKDKNSPEQGEDQPA